MRDGLEDNGHQIEFVDQNQSSDGQPNTIWAYSKSGNGFDTIQMINLLGVSDNDWRANQGEKETPTIVEDLTVKYYTNDTFESAWLTSQIRDIIPFLKNWIWNMDMMRKEISLRSLFPR